MNKSADNTRYATDKNRKYTHVIHRKIDRKIYLHNCTFAHIPLKILDIKIILAILKNVFKQAPLHLRRPGLSQSKKINRKSIFILFRGNFDKWKNWIPALPTGLYLSLNICIHFYVLIFINKDIKRYLWILWLLDFKGNIPVCAHDLNFKSHFTSS